MQKPNTIAEIKALLLEASELFKAIEEENANQPLTLEGRVAEVIATLHWKEDVTATTVRDTSMMDITLGSYMKSIGARTWGSINRDEAIQKLQATQENKYKIIAWRAYMYAVNRWERVSDLTGYVGLGNEFVRVYFDMAYRSGKLSATLKELAEIEITKEDLLQGLASYQEKTDFFKMMTNAKKSSFEKVVKKLRGENTAKPQEIRNQFFKLASELKENWLVSRTWGFEVEVPDAKGVTVAHDSGIEKGEDGSLRSYESDNDCQCDCGDCMYHDCDCEYCESGNSDPDHCGNSYCASADSAEFRTTGGIQRGIHSGLIKLSEDLTEAEAENNDTAGVHIHVYGADLTMQQVAQVVAIYAVTQNILSPIAGRENVAYAANIDYNKIAEALDTQNPKLYNQKPVAVNLGHLNNRGTIEFRQMACNFDWREITVWASIVRGIVNAAKRGARFHDFKEVNDLNMLMERLAKFNHTIGNEKPEEHIYGSRTDKNNIPKTSFVYA